MSAEAIVTILGMAAVTYAIRAGGLLLANRLPRTGFVAAWMRHIPGAVLAALIAPAVVAGNISAWIAAGVTVLAYALTRSLFAAIVGGVAAAAATRMLGGGWV